MDWAIVVGLLFVIAVAVSGYLLFPQAWAETVQLARQSGREALQNARVPLRRQPSSWASVSRDRFGYWLGGLLRHRVIVLAVLAVMLLPPVTVALFRPSPALQPYADPIDDITVQRVAALLNGAKLASPPPLPPQLFTEPALTVTYPDVSGADRDWSRLDADFRQRLLVLRQLLADQYGYELILLEGYRSPERQTRLAALGDSVTRAQAWQSYHQFGLAADCAFVRDGHVVISETDPWVMRGYEYYGALAEKVGLTWGGNWSMRDYGHVELRR